MEERQVAARQAKASVQVAAPLMGKRGRDRARTGGDPPLRPSGRDGDGSGPIGQGKPVPSIRFRAERQLDNDPDRRAPETGMRMERGNSA